MASKCWCFQTHAEHRGQVQTRPEQQAESEARRSSLVGSVLSRGLECLYLDLEVFP